MAVSYSDAEIHEIFEMTNHPASTFSVHFHKEFQLKLNKKHGLMVMRNIKDWLNQLDGLTLHKVHKLLVSKSATVCSICERLEGSNIEDNFSKICDVPGAIISSSSGTTLPAITVGGASGGSSYTMTVAGGGGGGGRHILVHGGHHPGFIVHGGIHPGMVIHGIHPFGIPMMGGGIHVPHPAGTFIVPHGFVLRR